MKDWLITLLFFLVMLLIAAAGFAGPYAAAVLFGVGWSVTAALVIGVSTYWLAERGAKGLDDVYAFAYVAPFFFGGLAIGVAAGMGRALWRALT